MIEDAVWGVGSSDTGWRVWDSSRLMLQLIDVATHGTPLLPEPHEPAFDQLLTVLRGVEPAEGERRTVLDLSAGNALCTAARCAATPLLHGPGGACTTF